MMKRPSLAMVALLGLAYGAVPPEIPLFPRLPKGVKRPKVFDDAGREKMRLAEEKRERKRLRNLMPPRVRQTRGPL